jgi:hypothetical protein
MKDRFLSEPAFCLGVTVWLVAATVFPLQLGLGGASALGFVGYLAIAGALLAVADALLNPRLYARWADVVLQSAFWAIGLAVPALIAFAIGSAMAPADDVWDEELCDIADLSLPADHGESAFEEAVDPLEQCEAGN